MSRYQMFRELCDAFSTITNYTQPSGQWIGEEGPYAGLLEHNPRRLSRMIREIEVEATK